MATALQFPAFPRHGILLNPSPSTSPYYHTTSLPGTPRLISSLSSLSSSASSSSPHTSDADNYFLTYAAAKDNQVAPQAASAAPASNATDPGLSRENSKKVRPGSAPHSRRIRFAPLPEPRREDDALPDVFLDDSVENLNYFPVSHDSLDISRSNPSSRPSSLLLGTVVNLDQTPTDSTPTLSTSSLIGSTAARTSSVRVGTTNVGSSDKEDHEWDLCTPTSPNATFSTELPGSCPESPVTCRNELPRVKERRWSTKLLKPLLGPLGRNNGVSTEDSLGANQVLRGRRESGDGMSSGSATPAGGRSRSRESIADRECNFGTPLSRCTSDNIAQKKAQKRKSSFLSSLTSGSGSGASADDGLWRTQSATGDIRRVKSRESEDFRRRSGSTTKAPNGRRQLQMLNGRVYGAKRAQNVNLFASARSDEPEFVEWGYGGMGSVKSAASVGADSKYSRLQGSSALGVASGERSRGRAGADEEDDGSGMAWLKKRKEQREREKREKEEQAAKEHSQVEKEQMNGADTDPPMVEEQQTEATAEPVQENEELKSLTVEVGSDHVTTAVQVPMHLRSLQSHHRAQGIDRAPSSASTATRKTLERKGSADTARAVSPYAPIDSEVETIDQMDVEPLENDPMDGPRERRASASSGTSTSTEDDEDGDADVEDSPKGTYGDDEEEEDEDEKRTRITALGAGVEKISRHKEKSHSVDGVGAS
ncbi:hypothetical protein EW026_g2771 [Hermanssonia centrifuga]|uniref:Uncharacterized protein n=1 Tax=Hermanssonia centrifuga TaxID=98765 RepID=A0A4S4KM70_9APHY|nr:hypothetical protein EW026_g2771 [Hermanssonia centrifuga]